MNTTNMLIPIIFLLFLTIYQADPDNYYKTIDETFKGIDEKFEEDYQVSYDSQEATLKTFILLFLKSVLYGMFAIAIVVVWLASIIPFSGETLLLIYIVFFVINSIPWDIILGVGLLINDKIKKKREKNESERQNQ